MEPGQIFFQDGVQVSRTIIEDPTLTSNDAPHNLSGFCVHSATVFKSIFLLPHTSPTIIDGKKLASSLNIVL